MTWITCCSTRRCHAQHDKLCVTQPHVAMILDLKSLCRNHEFFLGGEGSVGDPGFGQGGHRKNFRDFADTAKCSRVNKANQYWRGSRTHLRVLEVLTFLTVNCAFFHFSWYFFKFLTYIFVIYFNIKMLAILTNAFLVYFADTLVCKIGVLGPLWILETVAFLTSKYVSFYYPEHFCWNFKTILHKIFINSETVFV